ALLLERDRGDGAALPPRPRDARGPLRGRAGRRADGRRGDRRGIAQRGGRRMTGTGETCGFPRVPPSLLLHALLARWLRPAKPASADEDQIAAVLGVGAA